LPVFYHDDPYRLLCRSYWSDSDCRENANERESGYQNDGQSLPEGQSLGFRSVAVRPGCTFYLFSGKNFQGTQETLTGPFLFQLASDKPDKEFMSEDCECSFKPLSCKKPFDEYKTIVRCDAQDAIGNVTCDYTQTIGTAFSQTITDAISIDESIDVAYTGAFFDLFASTLGVSQTTGYNWANINALVEGDEVTSPESVTVTPGNLVVIEQVTGTCPDEPQLPVVDESTVKTDVFRRSRFDPKSGLVSEQYERVLPNGTRVQIPPPQKNARKFGRPKPNF
jgi:hypothetical protein